MQSLTAAQKQQLVDIINEEHGNELAFDEFADVLLGLLEDVPGFETAQQSTINKIKKQLWRTYHD